MTPGMKTCIRCSCLFNRQYGTFNGSKEELKNSVFAALSARVTKTAKTSNKKTEKSLLFNLKNRRQSVIMTKVF